MRPSATSWAILNGCAGAVAVATVLGDVGGSLRPVAVLPFILVLPGTALVRLLTLREPLLELTLGIALSLALATLAATTSLYAGAWSPNALLIGIVLLTLTAVVWEVRRERSRAEQPSS